MIDLNDPLYLKRVKEEAKQSKLIIDFFKHNLPEYREIDIELTDDEIGREFKKIKGIRKHVLSKIKILTSK